MKRKQISFLSLLLLVVLLSALLLVGCGDDKQEQQDQSTQAATTVQTLDEQPQEPEEPAQPEDAEQAADSRSQQQEQKDEPVENKPAEAKPAEKQQAANSQKTSNSQSKPVASQSSAKGQQQTSQAASKPAATPSSQSNTTASASASTNPTSAPATDANGNPKPVDPENVTVGDKAYTCTLSVTCATLLDKLDQLEEGKADLVPDDGVIFAAQKVTFYEGESVFNVLQREMKKNKIHLEFVNTPAYNSAYIEGINNLYEFDAGDLSGWLYKVNDWFPNYGCSRYQLQDGDVVQWIYTCDLGKDVGGYVNGIER